MKVFIALIWVEFTKPIKSLFVVDLDAFIPCRVSQALPDLQYVMAICQLETV